MRRDPALSILVPLVVVCCALPAVAADVVPPAEVTSLVVTKTSGNVVLNWSPVTTH